MSLIFLDVDGVLNEHAFDPRSESCTIDREKMARLNRVLEHTGASIVLSSAWRYHIHRGEMNLAGLNWLFRTHGLLKNRVVGVTGRDPVDSEGRLTPNSRGLLINNWLRENCPACLRWRFGARGSDHTRPYVVVDDLDLGVVGQGHPLVQTNPQLGLTEADAERIIEILTNSLTPRPA